MKKMMVPFMAGLKMLGIMTLVCGVFYTILITGIGQIFFNDKANGQIIMKKDTKGETVIVGSALIGQNFSGPEFLWGRPSPEVSNLSPVSQEQKEVVEKRVEEIRKMMPSATDIPDELVMGSGSGLDPEISLETALYQASRIAEVRLISEQEVIDVIEKHTKGQLFGKIGHNRVNVLAVNLDLAKFD